MAHEWSVDLDVREDESSAWLPADQLPTATVGDGVTVRSAHLHSARRGTIVETVDDTSRGTFHRLAF